MPKQKQMKEQELGRKELGGRRQNSPKKCPRPEPVTRRKKAGGTGLIAVAGSY